MNFSKRRFEPLRIWSALVALVFLIGLSGCAHPTTSTSQTACGSAPGTVTTPSFVISLHVGPMEPMYTRAQVKSEHPKVGEIMLSGQMAGGGMNMGSSPRMGGSVSPMAGGPPSSMAQMSPSSQMAAPGTRHLEAHICSRATGKVLAHAHPGITIVDETAGGETQQVPVAAMEGIGQGTGDLHYGNNVSMPGGHSFVVRVSLSGQQAVFHVSALLKEA